MILRADCNSVVTKGTYGRIISLHPDGEGKPDQFGMVEWERAIGGAAPGQLPAPERVALEGRFKYTVFKPDDEELGELALRSGLGAVASLHGKPLLRDSQIVERRMPLTHVVPDLGHLQSGTHLQKSAGVRSAYIYSAPLVERVEDMRVTPTDDEDDEEEACVPTHFETRLRPGRVFFEFKGTPSEKVEIMYLYTGFGEEYDLKKPTPPDAPSQVKKPILFGLKFKRTIVEGQPKLYFLQGSSRSLEHDMSQVVLSAVPITSSTIGQLYMVEGRTDALFGPELLIAANKVIGSSDLFADHREHGLLHPITPLFQLDKLSRRRSTDKEAEQLEALVVSLHAQMLKAVAAVHGRNYSTGTHKMSQAMLGELNREVLQSFAAATAHVRKHLLWLLGDKGAEPLRALMLKVSAKLPELQAAAIAALDLPARASTTLQAEISGAQGLEAQVEKAQGGKFRKVPGGKPDAGKKQASPSAPPPPPGGGGGGAAKKRLAEMLGSGPQPVGASPATDLAAQLQAQLAKCPTAEEVGELRKETDSLRVKLRDETLRADRESQRATAEEGNASREAARAERPPPLPPAAR